MNNAPADSAPAQPASKRSLARRIGCGILLVFWFALLLVPCFCFVLATNQEIVIPTGELPGQHIRIWLIMEIAERGLGVSAASVFHESESRACVETHNRFLLWQGRSDDVISCECYERESNQHPWVITVMNSGACPANVR